MRREAEAPYGGHQPHEWADVEADSVVPGHAGGKRSPDAIWLQPPEKP